MARILILGGAGFIGSNLSQALVARGIRPKIFTRPGYTLANIEDIMQQVDIFYGDFMDDVALRNATREVDTVYHLISTTFPGMTLESSVYDTLSNLLPTIRLLESCIANGVRKLIYASSGGTIYGEPDNTPIDEDHRLLPKSAYGQSKLTIENFLSFYARTTPLEVDILRISNPYGPRQNPFGIQGLVAVAMACAHSGRPLKIYGRGETIRDYIYIDDVIEAMLKTSELAGSITVNISGAEGRSVMEIVELVEEVSGKRIKREFVDSRKGDVSANVLSNLRAAETLGWQPTIKLETGLRRTWDWVQRRLRS